MIVATLMWPVFPDAQAPDAGVDLFVETQRQGPGRDDHRLTLEVARNGAAVWTKMITFEIDAPFAVPDLSTVDAFVIASLFPAMEIGGTLRVHVRASRTLVRNVLDFQSAWFMAAPQHCRTFSLQVDAVDDYAVAADGPEPNAILSFTAGMDAMLALCRIAVAAKNVSEPCSALLPAGTQFRRPFPRGCDSRTSVWAWGVVRRCSGFQAYWPLPSVTACSITRPFENCADAIVSNG